MPSIEEKREGSSISGCRRRQQTNHERTHRSLDGQAICPEDEPIGSLVLLQSGLRKQRQCGLWRTVS